MSNVILIGMPGCGKSTVGVVLAKMMGYDFLDVDLMIQRKYGARLQTLIDTWGNQRFADMEAETMAEIRCDHTVVATGGSAALHPVAASAMKELGTVVYLNRSCQEIISRIHNLDSRGITLEPGQTLEDLYAFRTPYYEAVADVTVSGELESVEDTARAVIAALKGDAEA